MQLNQPNVGEHDPDAEDLALRRLLRYGVLPLWLVTGVLDWYCHKTSDIEHTSGTHESLTHALMIVAIGVPVTAALVLDINALIIAVMIGSCLAHEGITIWDVAYANGRREISMVEQHTHSFLETVPFAALALTICLKPKQFAALCGRGPEKARWRIDAKKPALSVAYVAAILGASFALLALPYGEELIRCYRVDRTFFPHD